MQKKKISSYNWPMKRTACKSWNKLTLCFVDKAQTKVLRESQNDRTVPGESQINRNSHIQRIKKPWSKQWFYYHGVPPRYANKFAFRPFPVLHSGQVLSMPHKRKNDMAQHLRRGEGTLVTPERANAKRKNLGKPLKWNNLTNAWKTLGANSLNKVCLAITS